MTKPRRHLFTVADRGPAVESASGKSAPLDEGRRNVYSRAPMFERMFMKLGAFSVIFMTLVASRAAAYSIPLTLYPTGVGSNGVVLSSGATDPHYRRTQSPDGAPVGTSAVVVFGPPAAWVPNTSSYAWIGVSGAGGSAPGGLYDFTTTFSLTNLDPATTTVTANCSSDDESLVILLNAVPIDGVACGSFKGLKSFTIPAGAPFQVGQNSIVFRIHNANTGSSNPTGILVASLSGTSGCSTNSVCKSGYVCNSRQAQCDQDQDGDTVYDLEECPTLESQGAASCPDSDGDGLADYLDTDDDNDTIDTLTEFSDSQAIDNNDVDGDGLNNWIDTDSNDDGLSDGRQGRTDTFGDGIPAYLHMGAVASVGGGGTADCSVGGVRRSARSSFTGPAFFLGLFVFSCVRRARRRRRH